MAAEFCILARNVRVGVFEGLCLRCEGFALVLYLEIPEWRALMKVELSIGPT